jgi:hypothetical protein
MEVRMKAIKVGLLLLFLLILNHSGIADTIIPGGSVSGVWNLAGSPYLIQDDIGIQAGESLIIESGVEILFTYHTKLTVYGSLRAEGTWQDSVLISCPGVWYGIDIDSATDTCVFNYCTIENVHKETGAPSGGALDCENSILTVTHCIIRNNDAMWGAAIRCINSEVRIEYSVFEDNNGYEGSCIYVSGCSPTIRYCGFYDNTGYYG